MYAIIRSGGHQEKVAVGETITVDHLKQEPGTQVTFVPLLISTDDGETVTDHAKLQESAQVMGNVVAHVKGEKLEVFQYRQKTGYRRHVGARQLMTLVEIAEIRFGGKVVALEEVRAAEAEAKEQRAVEAKAKAEAKAQAKAEAKTAKVAKAQKVSAGRAAKKAGAGKSGSKTAKK